MSQIRQTSHEMADSDVVIPWIALASSRSKKKIPTSIRMRELQFVEKRYAIHMLLLITGKLYRPSFFGHFDKFWSDAKIIQNSMLSKNHSQIMS